MEIRYISPFDLEINIGKSRNKAIAELPDNTWIVCMDLDCMPLLPDFGVQIHNLIRDNPQYSAFTCMTNRVRIAEHCVEGMFDEPDIGKHIDKAEELRSITTVEPTIICTGYCMIFNKSLWQEVKFRENLIAFDIDWSRKIMFNGHKIGLAKGIYMLHLYRWGQPNPQMYRQHFLRDK